MPVTNEDLNWPDRDRFVLSKGHGGVGLSCVLADKGYYDKELLKEFNHFKSPFGMHLDGNKVPGVDASTGSLGHGLAMAVGMALGARFRNKTWRTYCLLGDGECNEGVVWEALMAAAHYRLTNLVTIIDRNHLMIDGQTEDVMGIEPLADKLAAFGFEVHAVDGHNLDALAGAIERAIAVADQDLQVNGGLKSQAEIRKNGHKPIAIIADTVKGKGVDFMEGQVPWHYGAVDSGLEAKALASLERYYDAIFAAEGGSNE